MDSNQKDIQYLFRAPKVNFCPDHWHKKESIIQSGNLNLGDQLR